MVPLYATPLPAGPPDTAAAPEAATPPAGATPPAEAEPAVAAAPPGAPVAAPESAAEAPEAPAGGRPANVVGVDSYGQTSTPAQLPQPLGQPGVTPVPDTGALPAAAPTSLPPTDLPQGSPASPNQAEPPQFQ